MVFTVRAVLIGVGGAALAAAALGASRGIDGAFGAAAFVLAIFVLPVAVGLAIVTRMNALPRTPRRVRRLAAGLVIPEATVADPVKCRTCGGTRALVGTLWVCPTCDNV